ncbi:hypothetical protein JXA32_09840 [Candidatus Sumerlaeota bacterium]|nr:hypothetical protein [Candidatus Sumerlaeota bacterium]
MNLTSNNDNKSSFCFSFDDFMAKPFNLLTVMPYGDWYDYAMGYIQAAGVLIEQLDEKNPNLERKSAIFPILFCSRQYIELMIKFFIVYGDFVLEKIPNYKKFNHHLPSLWHEAQTRLEAIPLDVSQNEYMIIKQIVDEFTLADPASANFRYPKDKQNDPLIKNVWSINLVRLYERMHEICDLFEPMANDLSVHVKLRRIELNGPLEECY